MNSILTYNMNLSGFCINQAHDKLEEGRKQVETQDTVQLAKEVRLLLDINNNY